VIDASYGPVVSRTARQSLGDFGEIVVTRLPCPRCKRDRTLRLLPANFKCADVVCDFCGYLAQVKTTAQVDVETPPKRVMGAAWGPQSERMAAGIYFPLFIVVTTTDRRTYAVYYLPADLQRPEMFQQRQPLGATARRAGWVGYTLRLDLPGLHQPVRIA
jgi:ribosomal protein L37AE/L43A